MQRVKGTAIPTYIVDSTVKPPPGAMVNYCPKDIDKHLPQLTSEEEEDIETIFNELKGTNPFEVDEDEEKSLEEFILNNEQSQTN